MHTPPVARHLEHSPHSSHDEWRRTRNARTSASRLSHRHHAAATRETVLSGPERAAFLCGIEPATVAPRDHLAPGAPGTWLRGAFWRLQGSPEP
jgi:hypothetical protein